VYEAAIIFAATSLLFFACLYLLLPLLRLHHISWFTTYNLVLAAPMFILVGCAFLAYHLEGRRLRWPDVRDRFCLRKMSLDTWLWTAALAIFMFGGRYASLAAFILVLMALGLDRPLGLNRRVNMAFGVTVFLALTWGIWQAQPILTRIPLHALPSSLRDFLAHFARAAFMGIPLHGQWWIAFYYILVLGIWEYCRRGAVVARISATAPGSCQRVYGMGVTRSSVGRIPSILPSNRLGHDSHDADMLCSRVCGSISKKYLAGHRGPFCREQRIPIQIVQGIVRS
jgi:hypothetical protein